MTSSIRECLKRARHQLTTESANLECQLILANILGKDRTWLLAHDDDELTSPNSATFFEQIEKRSTGYPVAYILGHQEFWSLKFQVDESTLIPRPDTELLVEEVLAIHSDRPLAILDLGTGSGAVAIALASERPDDTIFAMDISSSAISIASLNRQTHEAHNVNFFVGDWCESIKHQSLDVIVSNPPYIENEDEHLSALRYEPRTALTSGSDGLNDIRKISRDAKRCLKPGGYLAIEHGYNQQANVLAILETEGFTKIEGKVDLGNNPRIVMAQKP